MKITSSTSLIGLIGNPIGHSISPLIHNFFCEEYGLDLAYFSFNVKEEELKNSIVSMKSLGIKGLNVTIPYKQKVIEYIDFLDETADIIGSVNTIKLENDKLIGYNTDCLGFGRSLKEANVTIENKSIFVLGSGGAARAVVYELIKSKAKAVYIFNRNIESAERLTAYMNNKFGRMVCHALELKELKIKLKDIQCDIMVNCTPVGMYPNIQNSPIPNDILIKNQTVFYDLIYNPIKTNFLRLAENKGCKVMNGLDMLIWQAAYAFTHWTGVNITSETVEKLNSQININK